MLRLTAVAISALMLTAAPALAQDAETRSMAGVIPGYEPSAFEQDLAGVESRMAAFGARVQALDEDDTLTEAERQTRMAALWTEYGPDVMAFTASAAEMGLNTAGTMMQTMNIGALVEAALSQADIAGAMASVEVQAALAEAFAEVTEAFGAANAERSANPAHDHP
ncbi:MAG: hypothetical protein ACK4FB_07090 [Brevundimonas sp.]|uniref:hypothetical protein n=1 Tax=Brevundimonas sp. TaxID=1871086 RepID=UPI00391A04EE